MLDPTKIKEHNSI